MHVIYHSSFSRQWLFTRSLITAWLSFFQTDTVLFHYMCPRHVGGYLPDRQYPQAHPQSCIQHIMDGTLPQGVCLLQSEPSQ